LLLTAIVTRKQQNIAAHFFLHGLWLVHCPVASPGYIITPLATGSQTVKQRFKPSPQTITEPCSQMERGNICEMKAAGQRGEAVGTDVLT